MIKFVVNGRKPIPEQPADTPLLWVIREELGLTGTKFGCGIAQCGACTVHINGNPGARAQRRFPLRRASASPPSRACRPARTIRCRKPDRRASARGYCQSGQIMQAARCSRRTRSRRASRSLGTWTAISAAAAPIRASCAPSSAPRRRRSHAPRDEDQPPRVHEDRGRAHVLFQLRRARVRSARATAPPSSTPGYPSRPTTRSPW